MVKILCQAGHTGQKRFEKKKRTKKYRCMTARKGEYSWQIKCLKTTRCRSWGRLYRISGSATKCTERDFIWSAVNRLSNYMDYIPLMISERLIDVNEDMVGQNIYVTGQFRSFNRHEEKKNRLVLSVFVRELEFLDEIDDEVKSNQIFLDGYVCKEPIYRKTPLGREIADLLIAVNRSYGKSDYIPCICWGRNARFASGFDVGGHVQIWGRIQSREYVKKLSETQTEKRVAYEVSVSKIDFLEELD